MSEPEKMGDMAAVLLSKFGDLGSAEEASLTLDERRARDENELRERAQRQHVTLVKTNLGRIPERLRDAIFAPTVEKTPAAQAALGWLGNAKRLLLLRGGVGVGKTFAAAMAAKALSESRVRSSASVSWHRPNDFVSAVLHQYDDSVPKLGRDLVIVDDVGRETKSDLCEALCSFLDDYTARIILTTNLKKSDFRDRYDARLIDRMRECGEAYDIKGESRRGNSEDF